MKYFIAVVPPLATRERIDEFRKRWPSNRIPLSSEPHITVKSPVGLGYDKSWLGQVIMLVGSFERFSISLEEVDSFGESILFLRLADSPELRKLHMEVGEAVLMGSESSEEFEYVPHLTLGKASREGMSAEELADMRREAEYEFVTARPIPPFQADFVRVYEGEEGERYHKLVDIPLKL